MQLSIKLDEKARKWLLKKGRFITISRLEVNNCCVPIEEVQVSFFQPNKGNFQKYKENDFTIFVENGLDFKNNLLELKLSGIAPFQTIQVGGLQRF